ncbi:ec17 protein [Colletotrichum incanum]|nr:ec17 protein [Colletotrichum incanum]
MTHITNSVVQTGGQQLCGQKGGILSSNSQLCTNLSQNFTDTDCRAFGDSFFATCGTARSAIKRGIYKREVTPIQIRPRGWQIGQEPFHLQIVSRRPIPDRFSRN